MSLGQGQQIASSWFNGSLNSVPIYSETLLYHIGNSMAASTFFQTFWFGAQAGPGATFLPYSQTQFFAVDRVVFS